MHITRLVLTALVTFTVACSSVAVATTLTAKFSMSGIDGTVTFDQASSGQSTTITLNLANLEVDQSYDWGVYQFPVLYDRESPCDEASAIGEVFSNLTSSFGPIDSSTTSVTVSDLELTGSSSIKGRSLLIRGGGKSICATVQSASSQYTAYVVLRTPIAGTALFRQDASDSSADTSIYTDFFYVDGTESTASLRWEVLEASGDLPNYEKTVEEICESAGATISDLSGKHGPVGIGQTSGSKKMFVTDENLPLTGDSSILGQILAVFDGQGNKISCGYVAQMKSKQVEAVINMEGVTGTLTFSQDSPYDETEVSVDLNGLNSLAKTYHVHEYPVPPQMTVADSLCGDNSVSGHWNPYQVDITGSPAAGTGTDDQYEVGDLSGKHGTISGEDFAGTFTDFNLPLFGLNSIVGRSVVLHQANGSRMVCATIGYSGAVTTGMVVFRYPMSGFMMFRQLEEDPLSDTSIYVDMAYSDGCLATQNHNWHVHESQVGDDYDADSDRCTSVGPHYNPFVDSAIDEYKTQCGPDAPLRCELGDLSGKLGKIDIPGQAGTKAGKYFYTDVHTPLSGAYSVLGRSVVFHDKEAGAGRLGCANVYQLKPLQAAANSWSTGPVTGYFKFLQDSMLDPTHVDVDVSGLDSLADGYHVHILPLPEGAEEPCSDASVKGHFNPFDIDYVQDGKPADGTVDAYEVGDISSKFESMLDQTSFQRMFSDPSLALSSPLSVVGRSMVIHKGDGTRWTCATIQAQLDSDDFLLEMTVAFASTTLSGGITLQQVRYADGRMGDTSILVDVNSDSQEEMTTYWSVFMESLDEGESCDNVDSEYNPYDVDTVNNYTVSCNLAHQRHCSVGDLSMKHGSYATGGGKNFYTDVNLDLVGDSAVIGRAIKFTDISSGNALGCANILPSQATATQSYAKFEAVDGYSSYDFRQTVAEFMEVDMWQVAVTKAIMDEGQGCQSITFWFVGPRAESLAGDFASMASSEGGSGLGAYAPTSDCPLPGSDVSGSQQVRPAASTLLLSILHCTVAVLCMTVAFHPSG